MCREKGFFFQLRKVNFQQKAIERLESLLMYKNIYFFFLQGKGELRQILQIKNQEAFQQSKTRFQKEWNIEFYRLDWDVLLKSNNGSLFLTTGKSKLIDKTI